MEPATMEKPFVIMKKSKEMPPTALPTTMLGTL